MLARNVGPQANHEQSPGPKHLDLDHPGILGATRGEIKLQYPEALTALSFLRSVPLLPRFGEDDGETSESSGARRLRRASGELRLWTSREQSGR